MAVTKLDNNGLRLTLVTDSPEETQALGRILGHNALPGDIYALVGGLGSGKTTLTQGILWGLGVDEYARSPTFVLVTEYEGRLPMHHMDLYRLDSVEDIADLGIEEYLYADGLTVIEWAEKAAGLIPEGSMTVRIEILGESERSILFESSDERYAESIKRIDAAYRGGLALL